MKQVIEKIKELYDLLVVRNGEVLTVGDDLKKRAIKLEEEEKQSSDKTKELDTREIEINRKGDIVALDENNKAEVKMIADERAQLGLEKKAFTDYSEDTKKENTQLKLSLEVALADCAEKEKNLKEGLATLEERKKNLKEEVIKEFDEKVFGKLKA